MIGRAFAVAIAILGLAPLANAQGVPAPSTGPAAPPVFAIVDNSFLVEEAFNQERGVVQNIFTWTHIRRDEWEDTFTQEWPVPGIAHQLSYTIPFSRTDGSTGLNDVLINYRYQLLEEGDGRPAIAPRASLIRPTDNASKDFGAGTAGLQVNVPVSKRLGRWYLHGDAGTTWLPGFSRADTIGGSAIWSAVPMLHLMIESLAEIGESMTVSPGIRGGGNIGEKQLVIGAGVPITRAGAGRPRRCSRISRTSCRSDPYISFPSGPRSRLRSSGARPNFAPISRIVRSSCISAAPTASASLRVSVL